MTRLTRCLAASSFAPKDFATPELKRVAPAMKSVEKGFFNHDQ
jgi:hypothetical protein